MRTFNISSPDETLRPSIQEKIDNLNKPKGSLGRLEELAMQVCLIQQTLFPSLVHPCHLLLGGDHGIEREGVSVSPRDVTWQQMINFTHGGGGVNMFCRQHGFTLRIVDVGVDYDLSKVPGIIHKKIACGTRDFLYEPAMSEEEYDKAIETGASLVDECVAEGVTSSVSERWVLAIRPRPVSGCICSVIFLWKNVSGLEPVWIIRVFVISMRCWQSLSVMLPPHCRPLRISFAILEVMRWSPLLVPC